MSDERDKHEVRVPLAEYTREIAREAARTVIDEHAAGCAVVEHEERLAALERSNAKLIGFVAGCSTLGGIAGAILSRLL